MIEIITLKGKKKRIQVTREPNVLSTYDSTALMKCPYIFIDQPLGIKVYVILEAKIRFYLIIQ